MHTPNCLNCDQVLEPGKRFCPNCGQKAAVHRITMQHFFHEVFHAFTHADKGIFHLLKCLATKPGSTTRNYITGKRQAYFNPFTFFLILMGIFVLSNNYFKPAPKKVELNAQAMQHMPPGAKAKYMGLISRVNKATTIFRKHGNVVAMVAVPFISFFTWIFFRRRGFNYAEHLTANMMFVAFSNLIFTIIVFPLQAIFKTGSGMFLVVMLGMILQMLYFMWGLNGFLLLRTASQRFKSFWVSFLSVLLWAIFSMIVMAVYIYQDWDFYKFFVRMKE